MNEIIIDGINLSELKKQYDALAQQQADMRKSIQKGSSKFISEAVAEALKQVANMKEAEELEVAVEAATQATELLKNAKFVSDVSGVGYYLPYCNSQHGYTPAGETITQALGDGDYELLSDNYEHPAFLALYSIAEDMESDVAEWNTSYC